MTYRVGIDIGSTATKAAVLDGNSIAYTLVIPTGYSSVEAAAAVVADLEAHGFARAQSAYCATGYGRIAVPFATKTVTEITCHGLGAGFLFGEDCTVVDIGGQDTKAIVLERGTSGLTLATTDSMMPQQMSSRGVPCPMRLMTSDSANTVHMLEMVVGRPWRARFESSSWVRPRRFAMTSMNLAGAFPDLP